MQTLRTPDDRFAEIPNFPYSPRYCELDDDEGGRVRVAWIEDGPLMPTRFCCCTANRPGRFVPQDDSGLVAAGHRVICPDLVGFGRSDKPTRREDHTYAGTSNGCAHSRSTSSIFAGDPVRSGLGWAHRASPGARIRPHLPHRRRQHGLPTGDFDMPEVWWRFRRPSRPRRASTSGVRQSGCRPMTTTYAGLQRAVPDDSFCAGPRAMPGLVPTTPDDPASDANRSAWACCRPARPRCWWHSVTAIPSPVQWPRSSSRCEVPRVVSIRRSTAPGTSCKRMPARSSPVTWCGSWSRALVR